LGIRLCCSSANQIHYFPKFTQTFTEKTQVLCFGDIGLREIHKQDLMDFKELLYFAAVRTPLQTIESDLFEHNSKLKSLHLNDNQISKIGFSTFDHLKSLIYLDLDSNKCISKNVYRNRSEVEKLIDEVKKNCSDDSSIEIVKKIGQISKEIDAKTKRIEANQEKFGQTITKLQTDTETKLKKLEENQKISNDNLSQQINKLINVLMSNFSSVNNQGEQKVPQPDSWMNNNSMMNIVMSVIALIVIIAAGLVSICIWKRKSIETEEIMNHEIEEIRDEVELRERAVEIQDEEPEGIYEEVQV
jgi:hypothetical protein